MGSSKLPFHVFSLFSLLCDGLCSVTFAILVHQYLSKRCFGSINNLFRLSGSLFGITRRSLMMPYSDHRVGNFCPYLKATKDTYNLPVIIAMGHRHKNQLSAKLSDRHISDLL